MKFLRPEDTQRPVNLPGQGSRPSQVHIFDEKTIRAVNAALAAQRPLLVRGEPGIGKSQLACAVARRLGRMYVQHVVDSRTESQDLLWDYDAVARLGEAQLLGALGKNDDEATARSKLDVRFFVRPGPLWWAFDWQGAKGQAEDAGGGIPPAFSSPDERQAEPENGCVVLIDEIDKAESDVPNGLLEALGTGEFKPLGCSQSVVVQGVPPLVMITTNNERALPDPFVRRCLVLRLNLPDDAEELKKFLVERGRRHFDKITSDILETAAKQLVGDRSKARENRHFPLPGQAEYLDLLRAVSELAENPEQQRKWLKDLMEFAFQKHPEAGQ